MKVALISDVHGNLPGLDAVIAAAEAEGVEQWLCMGDLVGYYYWPAEVVERLEARQTIMVRGNHERYLEEVRANPARLAELTGQYGHGLAIALEALDDLRGRLTALPDRRAVECDGLRILLCHGSPENPDAYIYPDAAPAERAAMAAPGYDMVCFGHTHHPVIWREQGVLVVNPGSVGQPRDWRPGACWALLDTADRSVALRREAYDMAPVEAACVTHDPALDHLRSVLTRKA